MLETSVSFAISFLVGLLIGIEREHSHAEGTQAIGVRTFILLALLGTLTATINQLVITVIISTFIFTIIIFGYLRSTSIQKRKIDLGITTEISASLVYCLGYMAPSANLLAVSLSALVLLVLIERQYLHKLARKKFKPHEIETTIILVIFTLGILPVLPNHTIDPWNLFNPRNFGILIVVIAAIQFAGYVLIRLFGESFGMALTGFLGGFVSSSAVFANLPHTLRSHPKVTHAVIASAILATTATLIELLLIILVASPTLLIIIIKPIFVMIIISLAISFFLLHYQKKMGHTTSPVTNPLHLLSILRTSIFIASAVVIITLAKHFVGTQGVLVISFLGGLFELQGISLATALLYLDQDLTSHFATLALYAAVLASFISKFCLLWILSPPRFALQTSLYLFLILLSGTVTYWVVH
ncbi:MAG: DUF4010 domain-containing protein [Gammaproteobacteria bacterium]|nr:DUF4010 domain-containing protein [Gammaproteobacteria bacterium]